MSNWVIGLLSGVILALAAVRSVPEVRGWLFKYRFVPVEGEGRITLDGMYVVFQNCELNRLVTFGKNKGVSILGCMFREAIFEDGNPFDKGEHNFFCPPDAPGPRVVEP